MVFASLPPWILGEFTPGQIEIYAICHITFTVLFLFIAYRVFITQNPYSIFTHTISFLGSWDANRNPKGWWIFSIGIILTGILFLPVFRYVSHAIRPISLIGSSISLILGIIGSTGLVLIGFIPSNEDPKPCPGIRWGKMHDRIAVAGVCCLFLMVVCTGIILSINDANSIIMVHPLLPYGYDFVMIVVAFGIPINIIWRVKCLRNPSLKRFPGKGIYSLPLWEWILFGILFFIIYWTALLI